MGKIRFKDCQDCGTKVQVPIGYKGLTWCDECVYEWVKGGARRSISGRDLDSAQEFQSRNEIEFSDI